MHNLPESALHPIDPYPSKPTTFPQFPLLPLELRRSIWTLSALSWIQIIPLSLSAPPQVRNAPPTATRKHLFATDLAMPPLLYTCHESADVARNYYKRDMSIDTRRTFETLQERREYDAEKGDVVDCPYDRHLKCAMGRTDWMPGRDVVMFDHVVEPSCCPEGTACVSAPEARYCCRLDRRITNVAVSAEIWNIGTGTLRLDLPGLETLYVIVDQKPCFSLGGKRRREVSFEKQMENACMMVESQMEEAMCSRRSSFKLKRKLGVQRKIRVVLVDNEEELLERVQQDRKSLDR